MNTMSGNSSDGETNSDHQWDIKPLGLSHGKRKSAFLPYKPNNIVLTNLQRGNTEASISEEIHLSFHERAGQGEISKEQVLQEAGIDVLDSYGYTPLHWACHYGQLCSVQVLIDCGANVNKQAPDMVTPLLLSAAGGHHEIVRLLLKSGADVDHMDIEGNTALMFAAAGNHPHTCNELLSFGGSNFTTENEHGDTAYSLAVFNNSSLAIKLFDRYLSE
ncbi:DNA-binding protein RFXANK-like [Bradysia coprophila]|uniref:DNA-binding protein RFXANK-like n=1 Tax=Bradysia coprophila TaxID=38358 RepID=UPI00187DA139|nr:DNA-binding protein RFXANK-like [Bradysia coprophila]